MKKIITLVACLFGTALLAQNTSTINAIEEIPNWTAMLSNLPNFQVTSGVLLENVVDYAFINQNRFI